MWLANVVMVKKASSKWHMYVNYTNLNKACLLPNIDRLIGKIVG